MDKTYVLEQVFFNPRDGSMGSQAFEAYPTKQEAMREANKAAHKTAFWQILECRTVWQSKSLKERIAK